MGIDLSAVADGMTQMMENPSQADRLREALTSIAEVHDSARLRKFLETGMDREHISRQ